MKDLSITTSKTATSKNATLTIERSKSKNLNSESKDLQSRELTQLSLIVSIIAPLEQYCFTEISKILEKSECAILTSQMETLGDQHLFTLHLSGSWGKIVKIEGQLQRAANRSKWQVIFQRTEQPQLQQPLLPYTVHCMSVDRSDVAKHLGSFFTNRSCRLLSYSSSRFQPAHSALSMQTVNAKILVPSEQSLGTLREEFYSFCDEHNYEAVLDPERTH